MNSAESAVGLAQFVSGELSESCCWGVVPEDRGGELLPLLRQREERGAAARPGERVRAPLRAPPLSRGRPRGVAPGRRGLDLVPGARVAAVGPRVDAAAGGGGQRGRQGASERVGGWAAPGVSGGPRSEEGPEVPNLQTYAFETYGPAPIPQRASPGTNVSTLLQPLLACLPNFAISRNLVRPYRPRDGGRRTKLGLNRPRPSDARSAPKRLWLGALVCCRIFVPEGP